MCPDPQLLSIYIDGELPSPWKEKLEAHLEKCSGCKEKLNKYMQLHGKLLSVTTEQKLTEEAREKVWQNLQLKKQTVKCRLYGLWHKRSIWQRTLTVPIPAAAAAIVLIFLAVFFIRGGSNNTNNFAGNINSSESANIILAAEEIPVFPAVDLNSVFQHLVSDGSDIIILRLPESRSFSRTGDPAIVRAADYRRFP